MQVFCLILESCITLNPHKITLSHNWKYFYLYVQNIFIYMTTEISTRNHFCPLRNSDIYGNSSEISFIFSIINLHIYSCLNINKNLSDMVTFMLFSLYGISVLVYACFMPEFTYAITKCKKQV